MTNEGKVPSGIVPGHFTDQLPGSKVPAVPYLDRNGAYWAYCSVPPDEVAWWKSLPNRL